MFKFTDFILIINAYNPSIILVSETWLKPDIPDTLIKINGFELFRSDRLHTKGGGVCIYIKSDILTNFTVKQLVFTCPFIDTIILQLSSKSCSITLMCVYRPPRTDTANDLALFDKILSLSSSNSNLIIAGDFNFPEIKWPLTSSPDPHDSESHFVDLLVNSNLSQLVSEPTRFRLNDEPSTLDLIITNEHKLLTRPLVNAPVGKSDHGVLTFSAQFQHDDASQSSNTKTIKVTNYTMVANDLHHVDWVSLLGQTDNPNIMWDTFYEIVISSIERHTHTKEVYYNKSKPWINSEIMRKSKRKRNLWKNTVGQAAVVISSYTEIFQIACLPN